MRALLVVALVVICVSSSGESVWAQQTPADKLFILYRQSMLFPESFDQFVRDNSQHFDTVFRSHLATVQQSLLQLASAEIDLCNQHVDPEWKSKCIQENQAAGMYFWCESLRQLLAEENTWADTWSGSVIIFVKEMLDQLMGEGYYVQMTQGAIQLMEPQIRAYIQ